MDVRKTKLTLLQMFCRVLEIFQSKNKMFTINAVGLFQGHEIDRLLGRNIVTFTMKTQNLLNNLFFYQIGLLQIQMIWV